MDRNRFIFLCLVISIITKGIPIICKETGVCYSKKKEKECCVNYYQENGLCKACPSGWFGRNCSEQCPKNRYGESCLQKCNCNSIEICNPEKGCLPKEGVCLGDKGEFGCCANYYQRFKNKCSVCLPGTYGHNCKDECPNDKYGYQCTRECNCSTNVTCDKQFGCVDQDCPPGKFGIKCQDECPTGTFGKFCTGKCQCKSECDKRYGCLRKDTSSFHKGKLLIVLSTILIAIGLIILILVLKIRGVKLCKKCDDFSSTNEEQKDILPVSNILYKGNKVKDGKHVCQSKTRTVPILSSMNNLEKTSESLNEDDSNGEMEQSVYNTLTLRVNGYTEPSTWTRRPIIDIHSDASLTCSRTKYLGDSLSSGELTSDESFIRVASIYFQKSDHRNNTMQTFQDVGPEYKENRKDHVSIYSDDGYVYNETVQVDKGIEEVHPKNLLMKELSCQLMNMNKR